MFERLKVKPDWPSLRTKGVWWNCFSLSACNQFCFLKDPRLADLFDASGVRTSSSACPSVLTTLLFGDRAVGRWWPQHYCGHSEEYYFMDHRNASESSFIFYNFHYITRQLHLSSCPFALIWSACGNVTVRRASCSLRGGKLDSTGCAVE